MKLKHILIAAFIGILAIGIGVSWKQPSQPIKITSFHVNSIRVNGKSVDMKFAPNLLNISMTAVQDINNPSYYDIATTTQWDGHIQAPGGEWNADFIQADLSCTYFAAGHEHTFDFTDDLPYNHTDSSITTFVYYNGSYAQAFTHYYALSNATLISYVVSPY